MRSIILLVLIFLSFSTLVRSVPLFFQYTGNVSIRASESNIQPNSITASSDLIRPDLVYLVQRGQKFIQVANVSEVEQKLTNIDYTRDAGKFNWSISSGAVDYVKSMGSSLILRDANNLGLIRIDSVSGDWLGAWRLNTTLISEIDVDFINQRVLVSSQCSYNISGKISYGCQLSLISMIDGTNLANKPVDCYRALTFDSNTGNYFIDNLGLIQEISGNDLTLLRNISYTGYKNDMLIVDNDSTILFNSVTPCFYYQNTSIASRCLELPQPQYSLVGTTTRMINNTLLVVSVSGDIMVLQPIPIQSKKQIKTETY